MSYGVFRKGEAGLREIIVDNFAGGGGASTGIEMATGRSVDIAINHDPAAIAMHEVNHPDTEHHCESVWDVDPREVAAGRPVGLCWLSPDCKHFSKAKGGKPVEKKIRGLAWVALRWAATVRPRVIMLENVEEFKTWGPLVIGPDGNQWPDPKRKGKTFNSFVNALRRQGYEVDWRELRACDYGAPTIRKRFFLIARRDGRPIVWPEPTHGDPASEAVQSGKLSPWRTAAECIDWSIPVPSIFESAEEIKEKYGINVVRPLAANTERRIARGIDKFIIKVAEEGGTPFVAPFVIRFTQSGFGGDGTQQPVDQPLTTIMTKAEHAVVVPHITKFRGGSTGHAIDEPLHTVTSGSGSARPAGAAHALGLVTATMVKHYGGNYTGAGHSPDEPLSTITATDHNALVTAFLARYNTETTENGVRGQGLDEPFSTQDTSNRFALVTANIIRHFGESVGSSMDEPIGTVTAGGGGHSGIVTANLVKFRGDNIGQRADDPLRTVTAGGNHHGLVYALMTTYYGASIGQSLDSPLGTIPTHDRFGLILVKICGVLYQIVDIGMRMLKARELFPANGFPVNYIIDRDAKGNKYPENKQVARCGNSVPPPFAEALVRANLPELCTGSGKAFAFERYRPETDNRGQLQLSM